MEWLPHALAVVGFGTAAVAALRWRQAAARAAALEARLSRDTEAERALAAADERARIAREMHDVVAHTLSVVVAQADGGRFAGTTDPQAARRALQTIGEVGRAALTEMRSMLGLLRDAADEAASGPQPSLADIPTLVAVTRERGLDVSYVATGTPRTLPIGAGLTVYRVVQEALTNVFKHAGPSPQVFVQLSWEADAVVVVISDDGRGAAAHGPAIEPGGILTRSTGLGIAGMRERVTVFGGVLSAGPRAGGGYLVRARLPLGPTARNLSETAADPAAVPGILAS